MKQFLLVTALLVGAFFAGRGVAPDAPAPNREGVVKPPEIRTVIRTVEREVPVAEHVDVPAPHVEQPSVVATAVRSGRWTRDDARQLLDLMTQLDDHQFDAVMDELVLAINSGRLRIETSNGSLLDPT